MASGGPDTLDLFFEELFSFALRPYDFVIWAFPWMEEGELENRNGPEGWQVDLLKDLQEKLLAGPTTNEAFARYIGEALQVATVSGHDVGKTALLSWLSIWAISTRENTRGRATANTEKQLRTIFWSELAKWNRLFIGNFLFEWTATSYYRKDPATLATWRLDAMPWSETNLDAFSGLHNYGGRVFVIFDEASGIHDGVWERVDGVMHEADTELIWIACSNGTKNHGRFFDCFNRFSTSWITREVDSRSVSFTNKDKINKAISEWGEDSDYVRVRYLGRFPRAGSTQLIATETIRSARTRAIQSYHFEALVLGVDVARFGSNESVLRFRRGKDARTIPSQHYRGLSTDELGDKVATAILQHECDGVFIDEGGVGGGVVDWVRRLGHSVIGVNFGGKAGSYPNGIPVFNKRAEMYVALREWFREGGCIEDSEDLEKQLASIEYFFRSGKKEIQLIPKEDMEKDGFDSPDDGDALALTFAFPVSPKKWARQNAQVEYDPLSHAALDMNWQPSSIEYH